MDLKISEMGRQITIDNKSKHVQRFHLNRMKQKCKYYASDSSAMSMKIITIRHTSSCTLWDF